ncbi:amino acid adenylation domain-containing protein [Aquincola sp. MAHUQ-54]|uniref:Amino acid adenylation domain-containing protein n=2 Tax=Sphaerotilaceae TaxID=2975441 RepID=A0AAW9QN01_9BURK
MPPSTPTSASNAPPPQRPDRPQGVVPAAGAGARYALSPAQQGLLFHALLSPGEPLYFEQRWCAIDGPLDAAAFQAAWQQVLDAHEALRSGFVWRDGEAPFQQPAAGAVLPWAVLDWQALDDAAQAAAFDTLVADDRARGFVPDAPPLMRCTLAVLGPQRHRFVWSYHHLLMDGWSNALVIAEVLARYEALRRGEAPSLPPARPYREHIAWLQRQDRGAAEHHWREALGAVQAPTPLPWLRAAAPGAGGPPGEATLVLPADDTAALEAFARDQRLTLNTLVQGAWALLLARASGQAEVLFGAAVAGRPPTLADTERRIGLFIATVPVPVAVPPQAAPLPWLQALQAGLRAHEQHAHLGLAEVQRLTPVPGGTPLFDSVLVFENYPLSSAAALASATGTLRLHGVGGFERTHYPLALMVLPGERLTLVLRHDTHRLPGPMAGHLLRQVAALLRGLARPGVRRLADLPALDAEAAAALAAAGTGPLPAPALRCVHASIAARAAADGEGIALVFEPGSGEGTAAAGGAHGAWTYSALEAAANRLARHLRAQGVGRGARVGVCVPRSPQLVVALLAVWKAGAAYVPLDPLHPPARRALVASRAGLARLVVAGGVQAADDAAGVPVTDLDAEAGAIAAWQADDPRVPLGLRDPAYLMFTSGSTGTPKGVAVSHGALANHLASMAAAPGLQAGQRLLALTTVAFDIAGLELWLPLVQGGRLVLASAEVARDAAQLARQIERHRIDVMQATPATWQLLRDAAWPGAPGLRAWVGGEALEAALARWLLGRCAAVWNLYGPTETTIWSTALRLQPALLAPGEAVPIGGPIADTRLVVHDAHGQPAPVGLPGELLIGGAGVAEGYADQPGLTAQAFVPDAAGQGGRLYRTGDLVRWRTDGLLDFLGRADHQVKLRGHRIELGEIEALLSQQPGVAQAAVLLRRDLPGGPGLVAYLRPAAGPAAPPDPAVLRAALQARLPAYMLPAHWQLLPQLPLTPNGKVDRRALPLPDTAASPPSPAGAAGADDPLQALVAGVWAEVLGRPLPPGAQDDFFALGGHSLTATRAAARLQALRPGGPAVPLRLLFEHPRLADFVAALRQAQGGTVLPPVERGADDAPVLPLPSQHRQWLVAQFAPASRAYTIGLQVVLQGALDEAALQGALQSLVDRHEALRTGFSADDGQLAATVWPALPLPLQRIDLAGGAPQALDDAVRAELARPFDLGRPPLLRATLLRTAAERHVLLLALHHIVADDASIGVLARELAAAYGARRSGSAADAPAPAPAPALRCRDVAAWQRGLDLSSQRAHWHALLHDAPAPQRLAIERQGAPAAAAAQAPAPGAAGRHLQRLPAQHMQALQALAQAHGATPYMVMLAGLAVLLQRYGAGDDLVVGSPVAGRPRTGQAAVDELVGMFVNTLPLRLALGGRPTVAALLARVRRSTLDAWEHQDLPFEQMLDALPAARRQEGLFDVMFSVQNAHGVLPAAVLHGGLVWQPQPVPVQEAKFPLGLALRPAVPGEDGEGGDPGAWIAAWEFDAARFEPAAVERMAGHWAELLSQMARDPAQPVAALGLLTPAEAAQIAAWSRPLPDAGPPPVLPEGTLEAAFLRQAAATPLAVALIDGERQWRYAELAAASGRLAAQLQAEGAQAGGFVGLWGERSAEAIVGMLAILQAGGAYVPFDPQAPAPRLAALAAQTGLAWVLSPRAGCAAALQAEQGGRGTPPLREWVVDLDALAAPDGPADRAPSLPPRAAAERLAYVMLTSGTTGGPKAVGTPHRGVLRLVQSPGYVRLGAGEVLLQAAPLAFDAATFEVWSALLHGGTLVVAPFATLDALEGLIRRHRVSTMWLTAGLLQLLVDERLQALEGVRQLLAGGDVLSAPHVARLLAAWPGLRLVNGYGPTETTTFACCHEVTAADAASGRIPIGRPIVHTRVQVLDEAGLPVPVGLPGELHIGGAGVARGYLGRPAATAEAFVPDPACGLEDADGGEAAQVLYRTGDLVRWRADGVLEFLGRNDRQVKLRGFRIEPAEIEQRLVQHPAVLEAVVQPVLDAQGRQRLAAWLVGQPVLSPRQRVGAAALRQWVGQALPEPCVPARFVWVDALPLTPNGKVDRAALPAPWPAAAPAEDAEGDEAVDAVAQAPQAPAAGRTALRLQALWRTLLHDRVPGLDDNFFDLGGDSIIAMQIAARASAAGLPLSPAQVFEHPTITALAAVIDARRAEAAALAPPDAPRGEGEVPLTPIQHWFFAQRPANPSHFNQAVCMALPAGVDRAALQAALDAVAARHDALRLRFSQAGEGWRARLAEHDAQAPIEWSDLTPLAPAAQDAAFEQAGAALQAGLDIGRGPLLRVAAFDLGPRGLRLLAVVHHLVVDGVSWRVLLAEWRQAFQQAALGGVPALGPRPPGPQAWAARLPAQLAAAQADLPFWQAQAEGGAGPVLPLDGPASACDDALQADARVLRRRLAPGPTQRLLQHPQPVPLMLAALLRALAPWTGAREALLALESHGRDEAEGFAGSVGWFTALHPLRLQLGAPGGTREALDAVARQCRAVPGQGRSWGLLRWLGGHAALAAQPQIAFNYLGQLPGGAADGGGLPWRREAVPGPLQAPANRSPHLIEANCWIEDGCWTLAWQYAGRHLGEAAMSAVADRFAGEIGVLLEATVVEADGGDLAAALAQVSFE